MKGLKSKGKNRVVALLMALTLLVGMIPDSMQRVLAEEEANTVQETTEESTGIVVEEEETETEPEKASEKSVPETKEMTTQENSLQTEAITQSKPKKIANTAEGEKTSDSSFRFVMPDKEEETVKEYNAVFHTDNTIMIEAKSDENADNARSITYEIVQFVDGKGNTHAKDDAETDLNDFIVLSDPNREGKVSVQIKAAGTATISATIEGNELFSETQISCQINISKATTEVRFIKDGNKIENDSVKYGESYTLNAEADHAENIEYSLKNKQDGDYVEVGKTGIVTVKKPKNEEVIITATATDNLGNYEGTADFRLKTEKADRNLEFESEAITVTYGDKIQNVIKNNITGKDPEKESRGTYTVWDKDGKQDTDGTYATVTAEGDIKLNADKFKDIEEEYSITVKANFAEDDYYNEKEISYSITVKRADAPAQECKVDGTKEDGSEYYRGIVTINAPEGYQISFEDNVGTAGWSDSLKIEETQENISFYLKNSNGDITGKLSVDGIYIDNIFPEIHCTCRELELYERNYLYINKNEEISVTATDNVKISVLKYKVDGGDWQEIRVGMDETSIHAQIPITVQNKTENISFAAVDAAGNIGETVTWGEDTLNPLDFLNVVTDDIAPQLEITYDSPEKEVEDEKYYQSDMNISLEITEANFNKKAAVVQISDNNGESWETQSVEWNQYNTKGADKWDAVVPITTDGTYQIKVNCTDLAGNKMDEVVSSKVVMDQTAPKTAFHLPEPKNIVKGDSKISGDQYGLYADDPEAVLFYGEKEIIAQINIFEENFDADGVTVLVNGSKAVMRGDWTKADSDSGYTNEVTLDKEGTNIITVECQDNAGNRMDEVHSAQIVIDTKSPTSDIKLLQPKNVVKNNKKIEDVLQYSDYQTDTQAKFYYDQQTSAEISITENYFNPQDVTVLVNGKAATWANDEWSNSEGGNVYTNQLILNQEGSNIITVQYQDYSENRMSNLVSSEIIIDTKNPEKKIDLSEKPVSIDQKNAENEYVPVENLDAWEQYIEDVDTRINYTYGPKVILEVTDDNFDPDGVTLMQNQTDISTQCLWNKQGPSNVWRTEIQINLGGEYQFQILGKDYAGHEFSGTSAYIVVNMDSITRSVTLSQPKKIVTDNQGTEKETNEENLKSENQSEKFYYSGEMELTVEITDTDTLYTENNFGKSVDIKVNSETIQTEKAAWKKSGSTYQNTIKLKTSGEYVITIAHQNHFAVQMDQYTSPTIIIDGSRPERTVMLKRPNKVVQDEKGTEIDYTEDLGKEETITNRFYYREPADIDLLIMEENFYEGDVEVEVNEEPYTLTKEWNHAEDGRNTNHITFEENGTYVITMNYTDKSGNIMDSYTSPVIIVDDKKPERTVMLKQPNKVVQDEKGTEIKYTEDLGKEETITNRFYYREQADIDLLITEENFYEGNVEVEVNEEPYTLSQEWNHEEDGRNTNHITFEENGTYVITMNYMDKSGNVMDSYTSPVIIVDDKKPERTVMLKQPNRVVQDEKGTEIEYTDDLGKEETITNRFYYREQADIDLLITEENFYEGDVEVEVNEEPYTLSQEWNHEEDGRNTNHITFEENGTYVITMNYTDKSGNVMDSYTSPVIIVDDKEPERTVTFTKPQNILDQNNKKIPDAAETDNFNEKYADDSTKTFYYKKDSDYADNGNVVNVTFNISEIYFYGKDVEVEVNGKEYALDREWDKNGDIYSNIIQFQDEGEYVITVEYTDKSGNAMKIYTSPKIVIDATCPGRKVQLSKTSSGEILKKSENGTYEVQAYDKKVNAYSENRGDRFYYTKDIPARLTMYLDEKYFFTENQSDVKIQITRNGENYSVDKPVWEKTKNANEWTSTLTIAEEGLYVVRITYQDPANNEMEEYISPEIYVDSSAPEMKTQLTKPNKAVYGNSASDELRNHVIEGESLEQLLSTDGENIYNDEKFYYNDKAEIQLNISEINFYTDDVEVEMTWKPDNNPETQEVTVNKDNLMNKTEIGRIYQTIYNAADWSLVNNVYMNKISLTENGIYKIKISYKDKSGNLMKEYISPNIFIDKNTPTDMAVSYKDTPTADYYYYNDRVELELSAQDSISGIDHFEWVYVAEKGISDINFNGDVKDVISYLNENITYEDWEGSSATAKFVIPIPPTDNAVQKTLEQLRGKIKFTVWDRAQNKSDYTDEKNSIVVDNVSPARTVKLSQPKQVVNQNTLNTKNTYSLDTGTGQSGNSGSVLYYDEKAVVSLNINEANFYAEDVHVYVNGQKKDVSWVHKDKDNYAANVDITGDGDYIVRMTYTDRSGNTMLEYVSDKIVIDTVKPVLKVDYDTDNPENTINGRQYFNKNRKVVITVTEHNFRADDIQAELSAKDVTGKNIDVKLKGADGSEIMASKLAEYLSDRGHWSSKNDVRTATFTYSSDANYTFDISYADLAQRKAANYKKDYFTVDKKAPSKLKVTYSTSVLENIMKNISFGYYNAKVTVTISAKDNISGVNRFVYSYFNSKNVSSVNAELIDKAIKNARITQKGNLFTAQFKIPKDVLNKNNQFNGKVEFASYDRSENSQEKQSNKRIVVDNIAPKMDIQYNKPVSSRGNIDYYSGNIEASIHIKEANFYTQDVKILVSKNGGRGNGIAAKWSNQGTDDHTGKFTLSGDGDYVISIQYKDRSSNQMKDYKSKQMTIDTKAPTLNVSKIVANSANKDKKYQFVITANDQNFDISSFKPKLSYITRNGNGKFIEKTVSFGNVKTSGKNYIITVDNLETDGVYTLTSSIRDYANHSYGKIKLDDGKEYNSVNFSINRKGSIFTVDDETMSNVNKYYIYSVGSDVVIKETNVDPIQKYSVKLNNKTLTEGKDFTTSQSNGKNQWSVRTYVIKKSLFEQEGKYQIAVESIDKTGTMAYSDVKNLDLSFVVDQKAPVLTFSGLENGGRYQVQEQTVVVGVSDDGGKPYSFTAIVLDRNGNPLVDANGKDISVRFSLKEEELEKYLMQNNGKITFTIPEGYENQVKIICDDYVQKADTNEYNQLFERVTVSLSSFIIFYANKPLFYSLIAVILVLLAGAIIIIWKRKKGKKQAA